MLAAAGAAAAASIFGGAPPPATGAPLTQAEFQTMLAAAPVQAAPIDPIAHAASLAISKVQGQGLGQAASLATGASSAPGPVDPCQAAVALMGIGVSTVGTIYK